MFSPVDPLLSIDREPHGAACLFPSVNTSHNGADLKAVLMLEISLVLEAADRKVFDKVPAKMDVHHYRRMYATAYYNQLARPIEEIPKEERYYCRRELKGVVYDKKALLTVSRSLGHSKVNVVAVHYLMR